MAVATFYAPQALACPLCTSLTEYGADTTQGIADATQALASTASDISQGFASNAQAITTSGNNIVSALNASANTMKMEFARSSESRNRLLEALKTSMEQLEQSRLIAETNKEAAESHGEANLPMELCQAYARADEQELAKETAQRLVSEHQERQLEERGEEFRAQIVDPFSAGAISLSADEFTEDEAEMAMEQASELTGERSFPVSPDVIAASAMRDGSGSSESMQLMNGWLRTSTASTDLADQISKRTKPTLEGEEGAEVAEHSLIGGLWEEVESSIGPEGAIEDTSSGEVALLKTLSRRMAVNNRIRMEQLLNKLALARMSASQIGYMNEKALHGLQDYIDAEAARSSIERGDSSE